MEVRFGGPSPSFAGSEGRMPTRSLRCFFSIFSFGVLLCEIGTLANYVSFPYSPFIPPLISDSVSSSFLFFWSPVFYTPFGAHTLFSAFYTPLFKGPSSCHNQVPFFPPFFISSLTFIWRSFFSPFFLGPPVNCLSMIRSISSFCLDLVRRNDFFFFLFLPPVWNSTLNPSIGRVFGW